MNWMTPMLSGSPTEVPSWLPSFIGILLRGRPCWDTCLGQVHTTNTSLIWILTWRIHYSRICPEDPPPHEKSTKTPPLFKKMCSSVPLGQPPYNDSPPWSPLKPPTWLPSQDIGSRSSCSVPCRQQRRSLLGSLGFTSRGIFVVLLLAQTSL